MKAKRRLRLAPVVAANLDVAVLVLASHVSGVIADRRVAGG
jgi:hypothetical protein